MTIPMPSSPSAGTGDGPASVTLALANTTPVSFPSSSNSIPTSNAV